MPDNLTPETPDSNQQQTNTNPFDGIESATPKRKRNTVSKYDVAALTLKKQNPYLSPHAIGNKLIECGFSVNKNTIYKRLKQSDYLRKEFQALEIYHREQLVREDYPLARKTIRKTLKSKDNSIPAAVKVQAAKIIYDKALADRQDKAPESPVNIGNIERLQVMIQGDISVSSSETHVSSSDVVGQVVPSQVPDITVS